MKILIAAFVLYIIVVVVEVRQILTIIKSKEHYKIYKSYIAYNHSLRLFAFRCHLIYSNKFKIDELQVWSEKINVDLYEFHTFVESNKITDIKKLIENFERYKKSYYDLERVGKMNTLKEYCDLKDNISVYNELKELYYQYNEL